MKLGLHFLTLAGTTWLAAGHPVVEPAAAGLSPEQALAAFETEPGLTVELVAAEPLVVDPVALAFDELGRLFVAENRGYPSGSADGRPAGLIALLTDTDDDGRPDQRTDFATGLNFPNGLLPWRGGLIVTDAPDVLWLADTNRDGRADTREVLLTGFATNQSTQLRVNDPTFGPDGWVYLAGGLSGGVVHSPRRPEHTLDLARTDVKFRPDTGELEPVEGKSQFGHAFDDFGNRFACFNRVQVQHAPLPARHLARNPQVIPPGTLQNCPELLPNPLLRGGGGASRIFPISLNVTTADSHAGTYSAACAVHVARGDALPAGYMGRAWSCDPTGNLVRSDRLIAAGGSFAARRVAEGTEALRSRDDWFRPVFLADGPDGALYVCDMVRRTIEHPEYLPEAVRTRTDFAGGTDRGRIWRIRGEVQGPRSKVQNSWSNAPSTEELLAVLDSANGWARDTAFRLLVERNDAAIVPRLKEGLGSTHVPGAAARVHLLAVFGALDEENLLRLLSLDSPRLRQLALKHGEALFPKSVRLREAAYAAADDPDVHVRYQAALAMGACGGEVGGESIRKRLRAVTTLAKLARQDAGDAWFRAAIQTSAITPEAKWDLIQELLSAAPTNEGLPLLVTELVRIANTAASEAELAANLDFLLYHAVKAGPDLQLAAGLGYAVRGADHLRGRLAKDTTGRLAELWGTAGQLLRQHDAPPALRARAARLLGFAEDKTTGQMLLNLLVPREPAEVQRAVVESLTQPHRAAGLAELLSPARWPTYSPALRSLLLARLTSRPEFAEALLTAMAGNVVSAGELSPPQQEALKRSPEPRLAAQATALLGAAPEADRQIAFAQSKAALSLTPNPARGRDVFRRHCAACHRLDREGVAVGPDLFDIRNQSKESILRHLVIPEAEIAPNFTAYECATRDGRTLTGLLLAESPASITLRMGQGLEETVPREQITSLNASRLSLMPQGLEAAMSRQELADLLAYLRGE